MSIEVRFSGMEEVEAKLRQLSGAVRADVISSSVRTASEPIVRAAKAKAPPGDIADSIQVVNVLVKNSGEVKSEIGIPGGRHKGFYGLFVERGTGPRFHDSGKSVGSMPDTPFLRPAFDEKREEVRRIFARELKAKLEAVADG